MSKQKDLLRVLYKDISRGLKTINKKMFAVFCLMDFIYLIAFTLDKYLVEVSTIEYLLTYVAVPVVLELVLVYIDSKRVLDKYEVVKGSGSLAITELMFGVRIFVHSELPVTYMMVCIPLFMGILFGSKKLAERLYFLALGVICIDFIVIWFFPLSVVPEGYLFSVIIAIVVLSCCFDCVKTLVEYEEDKGEIINKYKNEMEVIINEAQIDGLTRLYNFKTLNETAEEWVKTKKNVMFCIIDIDNFKKVNDTYGHEFGNVVLRRLSLLLSYRSKENVFVARYGGEEFGILAYDMNSKSFYNMVEKLRRTFRLEEYRETKDTYTFSGGIAWYREGMTVGELFDAADKKLYRAKHNGKNQTVF